MDFEEALKMHLIRLNKDSSYLDFIDISVESHLIQLEKDGNALLDSIMNDTKRSIVKLPLEPEDSITLSFVPNLEFNYNILVEIKKIGFIQFNQNFIKQYDIHKESYQDQILNDILSSYFILGIQLSKITSDCISYNSESNNSYVQVNEKVINNKNNTEYHVYQNDIQNDKKKSSKLQRNWIIVLVVIVISILVYNIGKNDSSSPTKLYAVNDLTYVATSKDSFDKMISYINEHDEQALSSIINNGQIRTLSGGTEVYLISSHFSYCIIRLSDSTENLWITTESLTKK